MDTNAVISFSKLAKEILTEHDYSAEGQEGIVRVLRKNMHFYFRM